MKILTEAARGTRLQTALQVLEYSTPVVHKYLNLGQWTHAGTEPDRPQARPRKSTRETRTPVVRPVHRCLHRCPLAPLAPPSPRFPHHPPTHAASMAMRSPNCQPPSSRSPAKKGPGGGRDGSAHSIPYGRLTPLTCHRWVGSQAVISGALPSSSLVAVFEVESLFRVSWRARVALPPSLSVSRLRSRNPSTVWQLLSRKPQRNLHFGVFSFAIHFFVGGSVLPSWGGTSTCSINFFCNRKAMPATPYVTQARMGVMAVRMVAASAGDNTSKPTALVRSMTPFTSMVAPTVAVEK